MDKVLLTVMARIVQARRSAINANRHVSLDCPFSMAQKETEHIIKLLDECIALASNQKTEEQPKV